MVPWLFHGQHKHTSDLQCDGYATTPPRSMISSLFGVPFGDGSSIAAGSGVGAYFLELAGAGGGCAPPAELRESPRKRGAATLSEVRTGSRDLRERRQLASALQI